MAGCISAMNTNGIGIGIDMSPGVNCDPKNPGINSLLLNRLCIQKGGSAEEMVDIIKNTPRGVTWNYVISDGKNDRACVVEAGSSGNVPAPADVPPADFKAVLPDAGFIGSHTSSKFQKGVMVRWNDYKYPEAYLHFNEALWKQYNKVHSTDKKILPDAFSVKGYVNKLRNDRNCPACFYFAPQREENDDLVIVTNHFIIPEMRFYAMHPWTSMIAGDITNDIQWRYDELNYLILKALQQRGAIDYKTAKGLISFLSPDNNPAYYAANPKSSDGRQTRIEGCVSIFDLKEKIVESHYGYYCDEWVKITLPLYVN